MSTELFEMEMREKGRAEGREEGRAEGRAEGREEGRAEGRAEGWETALLASIRNLIETMQLSVEQAMNALRIPAEDRARLSALL